MIIENKKLNIKKLLNYGFISEKENYIYKTTLSHSNFGLTITIDKKGKISTSLYDSEGELYTLHLVKSSQGEFVGRIKEQYDNILEEIINSCFDRDVFQNKITKKAIEYIKQKYGDELEFLWEKYSNNAIVRRKDNSKWYAVFIKLPQNKIGLKGNNIIEIIDLKIEEKDLSIIDNRTFFSAYHMNKKHWFTILLNESIKEKELYSYIDKSYLLTDKSHS